MTLASKDSDMQEFFDTRIVFLNSMVDRITSHREDDPLVPRAEPVPAKALVILDEQGDLPADFVQQTTADNSRLGLVIRSSKSQLAADIALKLRVANGTHTAAAHIMALCGMLQTNVLSEDGCIVLEYLDSLVETQITPAACVFVTEKAAVDAVWKDWRGRLTHPHFGLSTLFITQNGAAKGGIRLGPSVVDLISSKQSISVSMAFAFAALLRWLTPMSSKNGVYTGWFQASSRKAVAAATGKADGLIVEYADGLRYNLKQGWYEFRCACEVSVETSTLKKPVSDWLGYYDTAQQPSVYVPTIRAYLLTETGGNLASVSGTTSFEALAQGIGTLYARMVAGDDMLALLQEMKDRSGVYETGMETDCTRLVDGGELRHGRPLHYRSSPC